MGAIAGLEAIKEKCKVHIYTDSMYICSPLMGKIKSMEAKHFMKKGKPIKNRDYFIRLNQVYKHHEVTASHLYGHTLSHKEIDENKVVDKLAGYSFANKLSGEFVITVRRSEYSSDTLWAIYHGTKLHFNQEWCDTKPFLRRRV
jgi:ribonuclease HI